jgi:dTMP kinase
MRAVSGALIAFEGLDQSGKATQAARLAGRLRGAGRRVELLDFPDYRSALAEEIARTLRGERDDPPDVLQLLFIANRYEYRSRIERWIADGGVVLCDRYQASSVAYGEAQGLDPAWLARLQRALPQPDLTILLDIAPETALRRKAAGRDRFEQDAALLARVRESYLRQAAHPTWCIVDGERDPDAVEEAVTEAVASRLGLLSPPGPRAPRTP